MIGKLQGIVDYIGDGFIILMAGPVGYKVYTPENLSPGTTATLWINARRTKFIQYAKRCVGCRAQGCHGDNGHDKDRYAPDRNRNR